MNKKSADQSAQTAPLMFANPRRQIFCRFVVFCYERDFVLFGECSGSVSRMLDWGSKGCWSKPHRCQSLCVVSLNRTLCQLLTGPRSTVGMCLTADTCLTADPGVASLNHPSPILSWRLIMQ